MYVCSNKITFRYDMTIIRIVMELLAFVPLVVIVPLTFLEFFSNYAWICFTGKVYCDADVAENQLQNDRNFILIGFFVCAAILGLYNKMVKTPLKAKDRVKEHCGCCCS